MSAYWPINLFLSLAVPIAVGYFLLLVILRQKGTNMFLAFALAYGPNVRLKATATNKKGSGRIRPAPLSSRDVARVSRRARP